MKKIIILGAGMVGKAMAIDLSTEYKVKSVDIDTKTDLSIARAIMEYITGKVACSRKQNKGRS